MQSRFTIEDIEKAQKTLLKRYQSFVLKDYIEFSKQAFSNLNEILLEERTNG